MKLVTKITSIFFIISIVPVALVGFLAFDRSRQAIEKDVFDRVLSTSLLKEDEFVQWLNDGKADIQTLANRPGVIQYTQMLIANELNSAEYMTAYHNLREDRFDLVLQLHSKFLALSVIRANDGEVLVSTDAKLEGKNLGNEIFFLEGLHDTYIGNISDVVPHGGIVMNISTPLKNEQGVVIAVLAGTFNLGDVSNLMNRRSGLRETEQTYVVDKTKHIVIDSALLKDPKENSYVYNGDINDCLAGTSGTSLYVNYRGIPVIGAYQWMSERSLCIITEIEQDEALAPIVDLRNSIFIVVLFVGPVSLGLGMFLAFTITEPLKHLVRATEEVAAGNLVYRLESLAKDEIGQLSRAFDHMSEALNNTTVSRNELAKEITERIQTEKALQQSHKNLHALTKRLTEVEDIERRHLARELHDQIGSNLTAIGINLNFMLLQLPQETMQVIHARLEDSLALIEETSERIRNVIVDLRPPVLEDYGLMAALHWYVEQIRTRTSIDIRVTANASDSRPNSHIENALFQIAKEALTNISKHSKATQVIISLDTKPTNIKMTIADNGVGFDTTQIAQRNKQSQWGLLTMAERVENIGGQFHIESELGKGTQVIVEVKL